MGCLLAIILTVVPLTLQASPFVSVKNSRLYRNEIPYLFIGTNLWYGMNLGATGPGGDRQRLVRELDRLKELGVQNLRVLAASEGPTTEPWRIIPALQDTPGALDEGQMLGLDFLLVEMKKRGMTAVMCLNNFWPWSGGMAQYVKWFGGGDIPYPPPQKGGSWDRYQKYTSTFYANIEANEAFRKTIKAIIERKNSISGEAYVDDSTIMSWQLANEPRGSINPEPFQKWIDDTAAFIKSIDKRHLVSTGSEGETPWPEHSGLDFSENHKSKNIDYTTAHIWVQNWGYYNPYDAPISLARSIEFMKLYLADHIEKSRKLKKPLILEEFGISRDLNKKSPNAPTKVRDEYYRAVFEAVYQAAARGEAISGVNFWAWAGEGEPSNPGGYWTAGMPFVGDPPHEPQGWYSVYERDTSTKEVILEYANKMENLRDLQTR